MRVRSKTCAQVGSWRKKVLYFGKTPTLAFAGVNRDVKEYEQRGL